MRSLLGHALSSHPRVPSSLTLKVAQADSGCPELAQSSGTAGEAAAGPPRSPPRTVSRARSPEPQDPALLAVQAALETRRRQGQVGALPARGRSPKPASVGGRGRYRARWADRGVSSPKPEGPHTAPRPPQELCLQLEAAQGEAARLHAQLREVQQELRAARGLVREQARECEDLLHRLGVQSREAGRCRATSELLGR